MMPALFDNNLEENKFEPDINNLPDLFGGSKDKQNVKQMF